MLNAYREDGSGLYCRVESIDDSYPALLLDRRPGGGRRKSVFLRYGRDLIHLSAFQALPVSFCS